MIVHPVVAVPEADRVVPVGNHVAVEENDPCSFASDRELMLRCIIERAVVVVNSQICEGQIGDGGIDVHDGRSPIAVIVGFCPIFAQLGEHNASAIPIFADKRHKTPLNIDLFIVCPSFDQNDDILAVVLRNRIEGILDCAKRSAPIFGDNNLCAFAAKSTDNTKANKKREKDLSIHRLPHSAYGFCA